jgi:hypothetical protein
MLGSERDPSRGSDRTEHPSNVGEDQGIVFNEGRTGPGCPFVSRTDESENQRRKSHGKEENLEAAFEQEDPPEPG